MRRGPALGACLIALSMLAGCGGGAKGAVPLGQGATDDLARLLGVSVTRVEVPRGVLDDVAARTGLAGDDIATLADGVSRQSGWHRMTTQAALLRTHHVPHEDVVAVATDAACAGFEEDRDPTLGDVTTAAVHQFGSMPTQVAFQELRAATRDLHEVMRDAAAEDDHARASVLLYCYVFTEIPEVG